MNTTPQAATIPPAAIIQIVMGQDGSIACNAQVPSRQIFLMMMETAKLDVDARIREQARQGGVVAAPPGLRL